MAGHSAQQSSQSPSYSSSSGSDSEESGSLAIDDTEEEGELGGDWTAASASSTSIQHAHEGHTGHRTPRTRFSSKEGLWHRTHTISTTGTNPHVSDSGRTRDRGERFDILEEREGVWRGRNCRNNQAKGLKGSYRGIIP
jgi:hypothetical protein